MTSWNFVTDGLPYERSEPMASQTFQNYVDTIGRLEVICLHPKTSFDDVLLFADVIYLSFDDVLLFADVICHLTTCCYLLTYYLYPVIY